MSNCLNDCFVDGGDSRCRCRRQVQWFYYNLVVRSQQADTVRPAGEKSKNGGWEDGAGTNGNPHAHSHSRFPSPWIFQLPCSIHYSTCCFVRADNHTLG